MNVIFTRVLPVHKLMPAIFTRVCGKHKTVMMNYLKIIILNV
jgi:hypothetical protein